MDSAPVLLRFPALWWGHHHLLAGRVPGTFKGNKEGSGQLGSQEHRGWCGGEEKVCLVFQLGAQDLQGLVRRGKGTNK